MQGEGDAIGGVKVSLLGACNVSRLSLQLEGAPLPTRRERVRLVHLVWNESKEVDRS